MFDHPTRHRVPLADAKAAFDQLSRGEGFGKIVLTR